MTQRGVKKEPLAGISQEVTTESHSYWTVCAFTSFASHVLVVHGKQVVDIVQFVDSSEQ